MPRGCVFLQSSCHSKQPSALFWLVKQKQRKYWYRKRKFAQKEELQVDWPNEASIQEDFHNYIQLNLQMRIGNKWHPTWAVLSKLKAAEMFMKVPPIWMTSAPAIIKDSDFHTLIQVLKYICLTDVFPIVTLISMKLKRFFLVNFLKISLTFHMCVRGLLKIQAVRRSLVVVLCEMF